MNWQNHCGDIRDIVTERRIIDVVADLQGDSVILRRSYRFTQLSRRRQTLQLAPVDGSPMYPRSVAVRSPG